MSKSAASLVLVSAVLFVAGIDFGVPAASAGTVQVQSIARLGSPATLGAAQGSLAINASGNVATEWYDPSITPFERAVYWDGSVHFIPSPDGRGNNRGFGINSSNVVVGWGSAKTTFDAFKWTPPSTLKDLGNLGPNGSSATDVNNAGTIVGYSSVRSPSGHEHAISYDTKMHDLGTLPGYSDSIAYAINTSGQIAGDVGVGAQPAVYTSSSGWQALPTLGGGTWNSVYDINDQGFAVGVSSTPDGHRHAVVWQNGVITDITPSATLAAAWGVNNLGEVVGVMDGRGFLWVRNQFTYLDSAVAGSGWTVAGGYDINDNGQIAADAATGGTDYAVRITSPTPANQSSPTISGNPNEGETLTASPGSWTDASSFAYQWQLCTGNQTGCANFGSNTFGGNQLALQAGWAGKWVRVIVTAYNYGPSASTYSLAWPVLPSLTSLSLAYRPFLEFHRGSAPADAEPWRPLNIDSFFAESNWTDVVNGGYPYHQICGQGDNNCADATSWAAVAAKTATVTNPYLDIHGGQRNEVYSTSNFSCTANDVTNGIRLDCNGGPVSALYYHAGTDPSFYEYLDYWTFYRFNDSPPLTDNADDHEGDWEGMIIALDTLGGTPTAPSIPFVFYAQHDGGQWLPGATVPRVVNHVIDFVAHGSHAAYADTCSDGCQQTNGLGEGAHDGVLDWGNNDDATCAQQCVQRFSASTTPWFNWPGKWGSTSPLPGTNYFGSPGSPAGQARFTCAAIGYFDTGCSPQPPRSRDTKKGAAPTVRESAQMLRESRLLSPDVCSHWIGGSTSVAACNGTTLHSAIKAHHMARRWTLHLTMPNRHSGDAPGISEVLGGPLRDHSRFTVAGHAAPNTYLYVRVDGNGQRAQTFVLNAATTLAGDDQAVVDVRVVTKRTHFFVGGREVKARRL